MTRMSMSTSTYYIDRGKLVIPTGVSEQASLLLVKGKRRHLRETQSLFSGNRHNSVTSYLAVEPRGSSWTARKKICGSLLFFN